VPIQMQIQRKELAGVLCGLALAFALNAAIAQTKAPAPKEAASAEKALDVLKGAWVRPDGGYVILIKDIGSAGQLEAMYFNPNPLPFSKAQAFRNEGGVMRVSLELQAGGYGGSTYELTYDAATDRLKGIYYQAVMKQKFEVEFARK
jgi:hypothetical protein